MLKNTLLLFAVLLLAACGNNGQQEQFKPLYFDLKGYIATEVKRLEERNPLVDKMVKVNDEGERKKVHVADWATELANFSDADLNKSAWRGAFKVSNSDTLDLYESHDEKIVVKALHIIKVEKGLKGIRLILNTSNYLYKSTDTLLYYPDSLYEIRKTQHIRLLNPKSYQVTGRF